MPFAVGWSVQATEDLQRFPKLMSDRIIRKVEWFCRQPQPLRFAKPLAGLYAGYGRFRIGDYRIIFEIVNGEPYVLMVLRVKHRREAYRGEL